MLREEVKTLAVIANYTQLGVSIGTLLTLLYTLIKFATKPNQTQNERIDALYEWKRDVEMRLAKGTIHFTSIDDGQRVVQSSQLAIMDALIAMEGLPDETKLELSRQRKVLYDYLTEK
jgi:hypothetical protein